VVVVPAVDPPKPTKDDTGALPKSGGGLATSTGAGAVSGTLGGSWAAAGWCIDSSALAGVPNENEDDVNSAGFDGVTAPNTGAVGAISTSLTETAGAEDANIEVGWLVPEPAVKMAVSLVPVG